MGTHGKMQSQLESPYVFTHYQITVLNEELLIDHLATQQANPTSCKSLCWGPLTAVIRQSMRMVAMSFLVGRGRVCSQWALPSDSMQWQTHGVESAAFLNHCVTIAMIIAEPLMNHLDSRGSAIDHQLAIDFCN